MSIYNYQDYKKYLKDRIKNMPKKGRGFLLKLSQYLRVHPSLLSQVLSGKAELSLEQAKNITDYFGMNDVETEYFINLVEYERAGSKTLKDHFAKLIKKNRETAKKVNTRIEYDIVLDESNQAQFYSHWAYSGIRLLSSIPRYQNADVIAELTKLPPKKVQRMINFLLNTKLCKVEEGNLVIGPTRTHLDSDSLFTHRHHSNWRMKTLEKCDSLTENDLMYTNPVTISSKNFLLIREDIMELIKKVRSIVHNSPADELCVLNIDWIKLFPPD